MIRYAPQLRVLPPRVALFHWRARIAAIRTGDQFSLASATRADDLAVLLKLARGRRHLVELGTATGWTALSLVLDDPLRDVITYDPIERPERERYLNLVGPRDRERVRFVQAPGEAGPADRQPIDLLYVDSDHSRETTLREYEAWRPVLQPGAIVAFDDYSHPHYPGVRDAVQELGLSGEQRGTLFVHRV
jgi:predicted O-methyltransferase YrrM